MAKPRIAIFVSTSGHSGVDRAMKNLIPSLVERGYEVDLLKVRRHGPNLDFTHPCFRVIDLGTRHTYLALFAIARYLRIYRPEVMLSDKDRVNRTALFARWLSGQKTPLVFSSGTTISIDLAHRGAFERWLQRNSMGKLYPYASNVIVTSAGVADDMASYTGLARNRINVVPSPVVPDAYLTRVFERPEHPWFEPGQPPVILGVGELSARKGFDVLLPAFARLRQEQPCRLMILGKGARREHLLEQAKELGIADDVALPGYVDNPYAYMAHAALFAMTSRWEGLGFVLIEAMAVGTPVVSTDYPSGAAEILENGRFGRLVALDDVDGLYQAMRDTLKAPLPAETLKQAIRPYTISAATDAYLDAFGLPRQARLPESSPA